MIAVISGFFYFDIPQVIRALAKQVSSFPVDPSTWNNIGSDEIYKWMLS